MLARWLELGVGLAMTLVAGLSLAQVSSVGGMPKHPEFSGVTVEGTSPPIVVNNTGALAGERFWQIAPNFDNLEFSVCQDDGTACGDFMVFNRLDADTINSWTVDVTGLIDFLSRASNVQLQSLTGDVILTAGSDIHLATDQQIYVQNGVQLPVFKYARINGSGSGCTVSGAHSNEGIASCSRTSAGVYEITLGGLTSSYTEPPVCTGSGISSQFVNVATNSNSSVTVNVRDATGTLMDSSVYLQCLGK